MANELKMEKHHAVIGLWRQGWSYRRIAAELRIDRETVSRHIKAAGGLAVRGPTGPPVPDQANAAILIAGSTSLPSGGADGDPPGLAETGIVAALGGEDPNATIVIAGSTPRRGRFDTGGRRMHGGPPQPQRAVSGPDHCGLGQGADGPADLAGLAG